MKVEEIETSRIIPYANNPRQNDQAVSAVAASIKEFGFRQPIVTDETLTILVGHTRLKAAQNLGLSIVPVHIAEGLTEAQKKAYRIADNRLNELAEWDNELLSLELEAITEADFDIGLLGFSDEELDELLAGSTGTEGNTDPDDVPEVPENPVTKLGDIWLLGEHRLMCGDSTVAESVSLLLCGTVPHLMVTDPPYGVEYDAGWRDEAERENGKNYGARATGRVLNDDRHDWSAAWELFPGEVAYVWHAAVFSPDVGMSLEQCGFERRALIVWVKNNLVIGRGHYHHKHEPCWYVERKGKTGHWFGDRKQTTVWDIDKPMKSDTGHSTQKPVECMLRPMVNNSERGDAVYEPFSGSGTTIIAAEQIGRRCFAMELNPPYVDVAVRRWQDFTGKKAILERTGEEFDTLCASISEETVIK